MVTQGIKMYVFFLNYSKMNCLIAELLNRFEFDITIVQLYSLVIHLSYSLTPNLDKLEKYQDESIKSRWFSGLQLSKKYQAVNS